MCKKSVLRACIILSINIFFFAVLTTENTIYLEFKMILFVKTKTAEYLPKRRFYQEKKVLKFAKPNLEK